MTTYSSFPASIEFIATPGGSIVNENFFGEILWLNLKLELGFFYGSLPQPPDIQSTMCMCFLTLLLTNEESRTANGVDDLAFWRYAHREGGLRLNSHKKILEYGIDNGWLVMLLEHPVFTYKAQSLMDLFMHLESLVSKEDVMKLLHFDGSRTLAPRIYVVLVGFHAAATVDLRLKFCVMTLIDCSEVLVVHVAEIATPLEMASTFPLIADECCELLYLLFMVSEADPLVLLLTFRGFRTEDHTFDCFASLLVSFAVRLTQFEDALLVDLLHFFSIRNEFQRHNGLFKNMEITSDQFYFSLAYLCHDKGNSHISAPMRRIENIFESFAAVDQLVIWFVKFLPRLEKETFFSYVGWFIMNDMLHQDMLQDRGRFGQVEPILRLLIHGDSGDFAGRGTLLHFNSRELLMLILSPSPLLRVLAEPEVVDEQKKLIFVDCQVLLLQGQSREFCYFGFKVVAHVGGLKSLLDFFFGSLLRPPEVCRFNVGLQALILLNSHEDLKLYMEFLPVQYEFPS